jgi:nucleoside-diphosphate-sugar epimerase
MKVAVTGANGFLGSHVVERLRARGDEPVAVVRPTADLKWLRGVDAEMVHATLEDEAALTRAVNGAEVVVHLAGATRARPLSRFFDINVGGTQAVLDACGRAPRPPRRVVLSSSLAATGPSSSRLPLTESQPALPVGAYGRSKHDAEQMLLADPRVEGVVLRPTAIYGPRDVDVLEMLKLARRGLFMRLGFGRPLYNWLYAPDAAEAFVRACHAPAAAGEIFNVGDATNYTPAEWDRIIARAVDAPWRLTVRLPIVAVKAAALLSELVALASPRPPALNRDKTEILTAGSWAVDIAKARVLLGWEPAHTAAEGMAATVAWYRRMGWLA